MALKLFIPVFFFLNSRAHKKRGKERLNLAVKKWGIEAGNSVHSTPLRGGCARKQ
jgi:hypothetical protein